MEGRREAFEYAGKSVLDHVAECAPVPVISPLDHPFFVYVMGPYTAFDASYALPDPDQRYLDDPLFNPERHAEKIGRETYEAALSDLCEQLRAELGVRAFLATDIVTIPTVKEAGEDSGMSVLDQSIAFAGVSDAVVFIFTVGGLTTGPGAEVGTILSEFNLRQDSKTHPRKPRRRLSLFVQDEFSSATIGEIGTTYGIASREFSTRSQLVDRIRKFLENIRREALDTPLPVYQAHSDA